MKHRAGPHTRSLRFSKRVRTCRIGHEHEPEHVARSPSSASASPVSETVQAHDHCLGEGTWRATMRPLVSAFVLSALVAASGSVGPAQAKDPWKHYYKHQEKQAKAYHKFQRKQAKE